MTSGVIRARVRSRFRCRMISCPAAKQIRWVNPSIATVSPSRTRSATASCIVATLSVIPRSRFRVAGPSVLGPAEHAQLVAFGILHHGPEAAFLVDPPDDRGADAFQAFDLGRHRPGGAQVEMQTVLDHLRLR